VGPGEAVTSRSAATYSVSIVGHEPRRLDAKVNELDAALLDVMAQVEAILRCGVLSNDKVIQQIRAAADEIARDYCDGSDIVRDLCSTADALD
jgi:hypothetical protein